jgi:hypothetical protein
MVVQAIWAMVAAVQAAAVVAVVVGANAYARRLNSKG